MKKSIKHIGNVFIILFCVVSVFFSLKYRELPFDDNEFISLRKLFYYTSYLEDRFFDYRMKSNLDESSVDEHIVLAEIDDDSISSLDSWPIDRKHWSVVMNKLATFGARIVAFDVFFAENSKTCDGYNPDDDFVKAINNFHATDPRNKVIFSYKIENTQQDGYLIPKEYLSKENFETPPMVLLNDLLDSVDREGSYLIPSVVSKQLFPIEKLLETDPRNGFIRSDADIDGVMRHYKVLTKIKDLTPDISEEEAFEPVVSSFGLSIYDHYTKITGLADPGKNLSIEMSEDGRNRLVTPAGIMRVNNLGETKINWFGGTKNFKKVSLIKIINANDGDPEMVKEFQDKIVFVGSTAFGADDLRHTPIDPILPGVYSHINFVKMLLDKKLLKFVEDNTIYSWLLLFISVTILLIIQLKQDPIVDIVSLVAIIISIYFFDHYYFMPDGYEIKLFFCFFALVGCYSWNTFIHFYEANKDKTFLKNAFGSYISPELIDDMYKSGEPPKLGGDSGIRTAYFTDIQGFSTFSEKLTPTQLVELLNEYLTAMTDILLEEKGTLDKYEGDAIIAFFGAPMPLPDHAKRACMVAHKMQSKLLELRQKWISEGDKWPVIVHEMKMRIGINSGEIVTGNMGSASRMNYTMMGDSVNLAARLEESAKQYGIFTQVAKDTVDLCEDQFIFRELDTIKVVGKSIPVTTFDLLGAKGYCEDYLIELATKFKEGITLYKAQQWDHALIKFRETLELEYKRFPELQGKKTNPSEIYIERCEEYRRNPPAKDWDGVYTLTSK